MENENKITNEGRILVIVGGGKGRIIDLNELTGEIKIICGGEVPDMVKSIVENLEVDQINVSLEIPRVYPFLDIIKVPIINNKTEIALVDNTDIRGNNGYNRSINGRGKRRK